MAAAFPVIDLFAGPGGLCEGFSAVLNKRGDPAFKTGVSIEMDPVAHQTLHLRAIFRRLDSPSAREIYFDFVSGKSTAETFYKHRLIAEAAKEVGEETRCAELGHTSNLIVDDWIRRAVGKRSDWILIGGPPCQAYSYAGRSRRTNDVTFEDDKKFFLYREYLRIVGKFEPAIFVMENVEGILSSEHGGKKIFPRIRDALCRPRPGLEYEIRSFVCEPKSGGHDPKEFVIRCERYGLPQARHRVILLGVRHDYSRRRHNLLTPADAMVPLDSMLKDLPRIRSHLSKQPDSPQLWLDVLKRGIHELSGWKDSRRPEIEAAMTSALTRAKLCNTNSWSETSANKKGARNASVELSNWILDRAPSVLSQHSSRRHMESDLHRYLFAASYAQVMGSSPKLRDFPDRLLPAHKNARRAKPPHADRFRVQILGRPSTTITSHISKDGHYFIHPDPSQCRSLTLREAARLQTFPDNYFFMGEQTQRFHQVGNAVPPYLAWKLGKIVADLMASDETRNRPPI